MDLGYVGRALCRDGDCVDVEVPYITSLDQLLELF
jgi:hypothetical protein